MRGAFDGACEHDGERVEAHLRDLACACGNDALLRIAEALAHHNLCLAQARLDELRGKRGRCERGAGEEEHVAAAHELARGICRKAVGGDELPVLPGLVQRRGELLHARGAADDLRLDAALLEKGEQLARAGVKARVAAKQRADQGLVAGLDDSRVDGGHDVDCAHGDNATHALAAKGLDETLAAHDGRRRVDGSAGTLAYVVDEAATAADQHHLRHGPAPQSRAKRSLYRHLARPDAR